MAGNTTRSEASQSFFVFVRDSNTGAVRQVAIPSDLQVGLAGKPAELLLLGRLSVAAAVIPIDSANKGVVNVTNHDTVIALPLVTTPQTGRIRANLPPSPRNGQLHFIKDTSGTASGVPIDVVPPVGVLIDGATSAMLSDDYGSIALVWLRDQWHVLASLTSGSGGSGGAPTDASYVTIDPNATLTAERHLTGSANIQMTDQGPNAGVYFDLSTLLTGSGTFTYATVTVDTYGRVTNISAGATPPPAGASYVTVSSEPALSADRALATGTGISVVDSGPNGNVTLSINDSVVATVSGTRFTGPVRAASGLSGSVQQLDNGVSYLVAGPNVTVTSQSNGQVVVSAAAGSLPTITNLSIVAGNQLVDQVVFQAVGAFEFNPDGPETMAPSGSSTYSAYFQPIVEVFPTGVTLETQLYNVGSNAYVVGSLLSCSLLGATRLRSNNLSGSLSTGSNTYEMHMRITNAGAGKAICKGAKLFVTWQ